jgi:Tol biopolymer transport system component
VELWVLNLETKQTKQLTHGGTVNVEPRFSPDGKRVAFVSTAFNGHLHIFVAQFRSGELVDVRRLTGENRSDLPRYYYSVFDHEISPAWSPDGAEILFITNRGHLYGTGGFWRMKAAPGAEAHEIHYEETTWKARPDFSPDGKRIVYASYLERSNGINFGCCLPRAGMRFRSPTAILITSRRGGRRMGSVSLSFRIAAATLPCGRRKFPAAHRPRWFRKKGTTSSPQGG